MLLIYTVKSGQSLGNDRGMKTSTQKLKDPLSFEILIFRNGLPDRDDDRKICVAMPLTLGATWPCLSSFLRQQLSSN